MNKFSETISALCQDIRVQQIYHATRHAVDLYLVGGCVRDALTGRAISDIDLACALKPEEIQQHLEAKGLRVIPTGLQHQTVTVLSPDSPGTVEITSFRDAGISKTNKRSFSQTIEEDLKYRDFTINALAISIKNRELIDPNNGAADIDSRIIRAVRDPAQRFIEDPLRIFRMVRFSCQLSFDIDEPTLVAAIDGAERTKSIAIERVRDEFSKILTSDNPQAGLRLLQKIGLLEIFLPEISTMDGFEQNDFHHLDLFEHSLAVAAETSKDLTMRLAGLMHDVGKPITLTTDESGMRHFYKHEHRGAEIVSEVLHRLKYPKKLISDVSLLTKLHMRPLTAGAAGIRRLLRDLDELYPQWRELKEADARHCLFDAGELQSQLSEFDRQVEEIKNAPDVSPLKNLAVKGQDILALGIEPGPRVGQILRALHEQVLDSPEKNTPQELTKLARDMIGEEQDC